MESKHTKGKLECGHIFPHDLWIGADKHIATVHGNKEARIANAERLKLCWNTHDALLAACKAIIENEPYGVTPYFDKAIKQVEAAIAAAEGKS